MSVERAVKAIHLGTNGLYSNGSAFDGMEVVESGNNGAWDVKACTIGRLNICVHLFNKILLSTSMHTKQ